MGGITDRRNKLFMLDPELLFALYLRLGSYDHVRARLATEGIVNPETGNAFSRAGVRSNIMKSDGYQSYFDRRDANPSLPEEPTEAEYAQAAEVIKERLPIQLETLNKAIQHKQRRLSNAEDYVSNYGK